MGHNDDNGDEFMMIIRLWGCNDYFRRINFLSCLDWDDLGFGGDLMLLESCEEDSSDSLKNKIWVNWLALFRKEVYREIWLVIDGRLLPTT